MAEDWSRPVVHWEIQARDADKQAEFYSQMFNWDVKGERVKAFSAGIGAPEPITGHVLQTDKPGIVLYIQVLKLAESVARCQELGGGLLREPFDTPGGQTVAWVSDPEGNRLVLVQQ
ncbi:MAG: VOC family protein [Tepidiformaceae bacterium]